MIQSTWLRLAALSAVGLLPAFADQASKRALIDEMLTLSKSDSLIQSVIEQQRGALHQKIQEVVDSNSDLQAHAKDLEPVLNEFQGKTIDVMQNALDWTKLKPQIAAIYDSVFTEEELAGAVAFYKTPAGQALLNKMPALMSASMKLMQEKIAEVTPQIQQLGQELKQKISKMAAEKAK